MSEMTPEMTQAKLNSLVEAVVSGKPLTREARAACRLVEMTYTCKCGVTFLTMKLSIIRGNPHTSELWIRQAHRKHQAADDCKLEIGK